MEKKNNSTAKKNGVFSTLGNWFRRTFRGGSKEMSDDEKFAIEKIESPSVMATKAFFRRKLAVVALVVLIGMFLFVFIGPYFVPMDLNYTDPLQANMPPINNMKTVPEGLKNQIKDINGFADFTVGVSKDNTFYLWGNVKNNLTGVDYSDYPDAIQPGKVVAAAAGSDHIIAVTTDGEVIGWGSNGNAQYGYLKNPNDPYTEEPEELINGTIDPDHVRQLICGYQVTALVMDDGRMYMWGNNNSMLSLVEFANKEKYNTEVKKVAFSNYYAILLKEDGTVTGGQTLTFNKQTAYSNKDGQIKNLRTYMKDRKVLDIAATNNCYCFVMDDGSMVVFGASEYGEKDIPEATANEKIVGVKAGTRHFVAVSETGNVYAWGHNDGGQCNVDGDRCSLVYTGSKQSYMVDSEDKLVESVGFSGYPLGTDSRGRDILTRIIHGGKMTMTIGAVAAIFSTISRCGFHHNRRYSGLPFRLLRRLGGYAAHAHNGDFLLAALPAVRHDAFLRHTNDADRRKNQNIHNHDNTWLAELDGSCPHDSRSGVGGAREGVRNCCQVNGRKGEQNSLQAYSSQRHIHYSGEHHFGLCRMHAYRVQPFLPGLRRTAAAAHMGQYA